MSSDEPPSGAKPGHGAVSAPAKDRQNTLAVIVFTLTTFLSALLLFSIQPMFAKMVLPILGGSPSVWAVALLFFQGALLAGYAYAHVLSRLLPIQQGGFVHLGLFVVALIALPIAIPSGWTEPPPGEPYLWQLGLFTLALGLPFVAVAANAPLLQAWFARTGASSTSNPYFLYAASNLGSLIALLGYPLVLEPAFGVSALSRSWTVGFLLLGLAIAIAFLTMRRALDAAPQQAAELASTDEIAAPHPTLLDRLTWIWLAMVPAALLTAITTHISTDIASAPLIWVIPLALYLLTFVLVFHNSWIVPWWALSGVQLLAVVAALLQLSQTRHESALIGASFGLIAFFLSAMASHRALYESRPPARDLTEFYLWMSFGGVVGGLFAALVAPRIFSEVFEYPLLLALAVCCRPGAIGRKLPSFNDALTMILIGSLAGLAIYWVPWIVRTYSLDTGRLGLTFYLAAALSIGVFALILMPARQLVLALAMFATIALLPSGVKRGDAQRSYFGVYRVMEASDGEFNILTHGTTLHGAQRIRDNEGTLITDITPGTYYHPTSPMAKSVEVQRKAVTDLGRKLKVGVIGLGTGSLACYAEEGEAWRFFEIDQTVVGIASDPEKFSFLSNCLPSPDIVIGDARLTMAKQPDGYFDLIIVDAFSSDAVPVHLMTREALRLFASKISPNGVFVLHISNRYLDLDGVVGATITLTPELTGIIVSDDTSDGTYGSSTSTVAVLAKSEAPLTAFRALPGVYGLEANNLRGWTDDYSDVLGPFLNRRK